MPKAFIQQKSLVANMFSLVKELNSVFDHEGTVS